MRRGLGCSASLLATIPGYRIHEQRKIPKQLAFRSRILQAASARGITAKAKKNGQFYPHGKLTVFA